MYNKGIDLRRETYKNTGKGATYTQTASLIPELSKTEEYAYLKEVSSVAMQQSLRDLDTAYQRFFKHLGGYPKFKKKSDSHQSFRIVNQTSNKGTPKIRIVGKYIHIPTLGYVKIRQSMPVGAIHNATVERTPTGKYYVVVNTDFNNERMDIPYTDSMTGIDVGIKSFLTNDCGNTVDNPKWHRSTLKRLRREQRKLSHMIESHIAGYKDGKNGGRIPIYDKELKDCSNIQKQKSVIARTYEKLADQRYDFQQKLSTCIVKENQLIAVEDLNIAGIMKNHHLAQAVSDAAWGQFIRMLEYKSQWYGRTFVKVPTFYPSSQTCHVCGYKNSKVKNLKVREWTCPECGTHHERDTNAAVNILSKALEMTAA